ncbi:MAG: succinate--CoA ligase subunit beta [Synechococcaceae cyanobacterium SM2_3_1]|nr:succinate--CoA ligase subunit beta [Synechococcaceae cyanobacterium SM2_3_1]
MELLEYQAKDLFRRAGIPVLPSARIEHPTQLKKLTIPYPIALKSQVHTGGRGKAGGVRFADNTIDAIAAAQVIFGLPIHGERPRVILAEQKYRSANEIFLTISWDWGSRCPILMGSLKGGIQIDDHLDSILTVAVSEDFQPFLARRLAYRMGLSGLLLQAVADIVRRMYSLFAAYDLELIEINPLGVGENLEVMALDGKIRIRGQHWTWHPYLQNLAREAPLTSLSLQDQARLWDLHWQELSASGQILILSSGLELASLDQRALADHGVETACILDLGEMPGLIQVQQGLLLLGEWLKRTPTHRTDVIIFHVFSPLINLDQYLQLMQSWLTTLTRVPVIVMRNPSSSDPGKQMLADQLYLCATWEEVIQWCVSFSLTSRTEYDASGHA